MSRRLGRALTGSKSPFPEMIMLVTRCTKSGASSETGGTRCRVLGRGRGNSHLLQSIGRRVDRRAVSLDNRAATLRIGFLNGGLNMPNRFVHRQDVRQREETRLHDGVHATTEARFGCDFVGVNDIDP